MILLFDVSLVVLQLQNSNMDGPTSLPAPLTSTPTTPASNDATGTSGKTRFNEAFWGEGDRGYSVLMDRMKLAKHSLVDLLAIFTSRLEMEEDTSKRLLRLSKSQALVKDEQGTLRQVLEGFRWECEQLSKHRAQVAEEMRAKLVKPLDAFIQQQRETRKVHQMAVEKMLKLKQQQLLQAQKCEEKYKARCVELDQLSQSKYGTGYSGTLRGSGATSGGKEDARMVKAIQAAKSADQEYQVACDKLRDIHTTWVKDMYALCDEFQRLEEMRIDYMRNALWTYSNIGSQACVVEDESCERLRKTLEKCRVDEDVRLFIATHGTGDIIPAPIEYRNYFDRGGQPGSSGSMSRERKPSLQQGIKASAYAAQQATPTSSQPKQLPATMLMAPAVSSMPVQRKLSSANPFDNDDDPADSVPPPDHQPQTRAAPIATNGRPISQIAPPPPLPLTQPTNSPPTQVGNPFFDDLVKDLPQQVTKPGTAPPSVHSPSPHGTLRKTPSQSSTQSYGTVTSIPNGKSSGFNGAIPIDQIMPTPPERNISSKSDSATMPRGGGGAGFDTTRAHFGTISPTTQISIASNNSASGAANNPFDVAFDNTFSTTAAQAGSVLSHTSNRSNPNSGPVGEFKARVLYNYDASQPDELTLDRGQTVWVKSQPEPGWYYGELQIGNQRMYGLFPATIVEKIS